MAIISKADKSVNINVETSTEFKIADVIKTRVEKVIQQVVNECSTEFYRNIKADIKITLE